ncbi:MAG: methylated-DNA--[protein]-cysteine S-methyltransferase [Acidimicrobiia bacterium]|jgi:methylated-DNA-[protein]-cysteine S-methyltransferase
MSDAHLSTVLPSPVGDLTVVATDRGIRAVLWPGDDDSRVPLPETVPDPERRHPVLAAAATQLTEYFEGTRTTFDLPLDLRGTDFQEASWRALVAIPYGATTTYQAVARRLGRPTAARAVGAATGRNPISIVVPCHRVVGSDGSLTGFAGGIVAKRWLLRHEGAFG